jgi:hypothetical protein
VNLLSLPVALAAGISACVGLDHFFLHVKRPRRSDLYFALTCLCMVGYDVTAAFHYSATSLETGGFWQRWEIAWATAMGMPFLLFVNEQVGLKTPRPAGRHPLGGRRNSVHDAVLAHQRLPCLFMTGHADDRLGDRGILSRGTEVLRKPFTVRELAARVRHILDSEAARNQRNQA